MKLTRGKALIASNALVAAAGFAAMLGLLRLVNVDTTIPRQQAALYNRAVALPPAIDRMAYAPPNAFEAPLALRPGFSPDAEVPAAETADPDSAPETADPAPENTNSALETDETASWSTVALPPERETDLRSLPLPRAHRPSQTKVDDGARRRRPYTKSLEKRLAEISPGAVARLKQKFEAVKAPWPPSEIALVGIKDEKILELHARSKGGRFELIHRYPILAASGGMGPKLRQGDRQVPEGIYRIAWLNPNSAYHVSLRVSYPNAFDRKMARTEGRNNLGGDIMIHGKNLSAGCLAVGDEAVEEIFTVAAETGLANVHVVIAPTDLRSKPLPQPKPGQPDWVPKLYTEIASAMSGYESANPITTSSTNIASSLMSFFTK
ncbi:MAG: L,D-transpeptidase family protein [Hyphomicrobiaceae bacterium]